MTNHLLYLDEHWQYNQEWMWRTGINQQSHFKTTKNMVQHRKTKNVFNLRPAHHHCTSPIKVTILHCTFDSTLRNLWWNYLPPLMTATLWIPNLYSNLNSKYKNYYYLARNTRCKSASLVNSGSLTVLLIGVQCLRQINQWIKTCEGNGHFFTEAAWIAACSVFWRDIGGDVLRGFDKLSHYVSLWMQALITGRLDTFNRS